MTGDHTGPLPTRAYVLLAVLALGCTRPPEAAPAVEVPPVIAPPAPAPPPTAAVTAPPPEPTAAVDLLHPMRVDGLPAGEWTITYPPVPGHPTFQRIVASPRGGYVALALRRAETLVIRLGEDGTPRWVVPLPDLAHGQPFDVAVGEDGAIAVILRHSQNLFFEGREVVRIDPPGTHVSLVIIDDQGKLRQVVSRRSDIFPPFTRIAGHGGSFVTTALDLVQPHEAFAGGLAVFDTAGKLVRIEQTEFLSPLLAPGRFLAVTGSGVGAQKYRGRVLVGGSARGPAPYFVATFEKDGTPRWAHRFPDPRVHEQTALAQDERGHVFAAFRWGESHGYADDAYAAIVYELDEKGKEVHRFTYDPNASFTRLLPAPDGLTAIGWFLAMDLTTSGKSVAVPPADADHNILPALLMRLAPDGHPLAFRALPNAQLTRDTQTGLMTVADAVPAGDGYLAVVGIVTPYAPFAGLRAPGEPVSFVARIRRP